MDTYSRFPALVRPFVTQQLVRLGRLSPGMAFLGAALAILLLSPGLAAAQQPADTELVTTQSTQDVGRLVQIGGLGIVVRTDPLRVIVVVPETPAEAAGLLAGDVILAIDDRPAAGLTVAEVLSLVQGDASSTVYLTVTRAGLPEPVDFAVLRDGSHSLPRGPLGPGPFDA